MAPRPTTGNKRKEECLPLKTWKDFLEWEGAFNQEEWRKGLCPLAERAIFQLDENCERVPLSRRKSLFCHDMKGGYLEDRFIHGARGLEEEPYHFAHWSLIDIFVYFSHSFISVPPLGWINAAHRNGVSVLGTIILEGSEFELLKTCLDCYELFAETAAAIQKSLGFDGWLLNFEMDKLSKDEVSRLLEFTKRLTELCPTVIWYDSVTIDGALDWRNKLDSKNYDFFSVASGIYLNYAWSEEYLRESLAFLQSKDDAARVGDVFVGVDVFGRGCPGGGGFNSDHALGMISPFGFSVALFAPAWTYECSSPEETFFDREYRFWDKLRPYLNVRGLQLSEESLQGSGLKIDFHPGSGREINVNKGGCVPWWLNFREQAIQPSYLLHSVSHVINGYLEIMVDHDKRSSVPIFFAGLPPTTLQKPLSVHLHFEAFSSSGESLLEPKMDLEGFQSLSCSNGNLKAVSSKSNPFLLLKLTFSSSSKNKDINLIKIKYFTLQME